MHRGSACKQCRRDVLPGHRRDIGAHAQAYHDGTYAHPSHALQEICRRNEGKRMRIHPQHFVARCMDDMAGHRHVRHHQEIRQELLTRAQDRVPEDRSQRHKRIFRSSRHTAHPSQGQPPQARPRPHSDDHPGEGGQESPQGDIPPQERHNAGPAEQDIPPVHHHNARLPSRMGIQACEALSYESVTFLRPFTTQNMNAGMATAAPAM